jgi:FtsH-binding integral membrane protein
MVTQHICPFCGGVMYESGGEMSVGGWLIVGLLGVILAIAMIAQIFKSKNAIEVAEIVGSTLIWGFLTYQIFKRFKKRGPK